MSPTPLGRSLLLRLTVPVAAAVLVTGLLGLAAAHGLTRHWEDAQQRESLETLLEVLAPSASTACFLGDTPLGEQLVQDLITRPGVQTATLRADGVILAQARRQPTLAAAEAVPALSRRLIPPFNPTLHAGELVLTLTRASARPGSLGETWQLAGLLGLTLVLGLALALAIHLTLVRPLRQLSSWVEKADANHSLPWPKGHGHDELGQLTQALNGLLGRLGATLTREQQRSEQLALDKRKVQGVLDHAAAGIFVLRGDGTLETWTPSFLRMLGLEQAQPRPGTPLSALFDDCAAQVGLCLEQCLAEGGPSMEVLRIRDRRGAPSHRWFQLHLNPVGPDWIQGLLEDLSPRLGAGEALAERAALDPATGILNRLGAERVIADQLANGADGLGLMLVALEVENGTAGPELDPVLLREAARRMADCLRPSDHLARLNDRDFLLILAGLRDQAKARKLSQRVLAAFSLPINSPGAGQVQLIAYAGIAVLGLDEEPTRQALLKRAALALDQARLS